MKDWGFVVLENGSKFFYLVLWYLKFGEYSDEDDDGEDGENLLGCIVVDWGGDDFVVGFLLVFLFGSMCMWYLLFVVVVVYEVVM